MQIAKAVYAYLRSHTFVCDLEKCGFRRAILSLPSPTQGGRAACDLQPPGLDIRTCPREKPSRGPNNQLISDSAAHSEACRHCGLVGKPQRHRHCFADFHRGLGRHAHEVIAAGANSTLPRAGTGMPVTIATRSSPFIFSPWRSMSIPQAGEEAATSDMVLYVSFDKVK
jgi:hypothetical protein